MGIEYQLFDTNRKIFFHLGKGYWEDKIFPLLSDKEKLLKYITEVVFSNRNAGNLEALSDKLFMEFRDSKLEDLEIWTDNFGYRLGYIEIIPNAWVLRGF